MVNASCRNGLPGSAPQPAPTGREALPAPAPATFATGGPASSQLLGAYLAIENKIVTLEFAPGSMLTAKQIHQAVGFGRTPVREAIQRLTLEGLMEVHPRLGVRIAAIRPEEYPRAIEPRVSMEPLLARAAARYAGPRERGAIGHCMAAMLECARRHDLHGFLHADKALDVVISQAAADPFLPRALAPLQIHSRRFWFHYHGTNGLEASAQAHAAACEAIRAGDPEGAFQATASLMRFLLLRSRAL